MNTKILIADDNASYMLLCAGEILGEGRNVDIDTVESSSAVLDCLTNKDYAVIILDIDFGNTEQDGLSLVSTIRHQYPRIGILMHSNSSDMDTVVKARHLGVDDFVSKGCSLKELGIRLQALIARRDANRALAERAALVAREVGAFFESAAMRRVFGEVARLVDVRGINILVRGPTGAGKELVARALQSKDSNRPFVTVNCAAIPGQLIESELFGHVKGSFTGAIRDHKGKFEEANGGDIFLDEIACLPMPAQMALLRVLEEKEIKRVGSSEIKKLSFRVIAATNEDLEELVRQGKFREELLARLKGASILIPPLSERREDILPIAYSVLRKAGYPGLRIAPDCEQILRELPWPNNVRQLKQAIIAMAATSNSGVITVGDIPLELIPQRSGQNVHKFAPRSKMLVLELPINNVTYDDAKDELLRLLIEAKQASMGRNASQTEIAKSLAIGRSSFQRFVKRQSLSRMML